MIPNGILKMLQNYFWLMHSIILFDILILFPRLFWKRTLSFIWLRRILSLVHLSVFFSGASLHGWESVIAKTIKKQTNIMFGMKMTNYVNVIVVFNNFISLIGKGNAIATIQLSFSYNISHAWPKIDSQTQKQTFSYQHNLSMLSFPCL